MGFPYDLDSVDDEISDEQIEQLLHNAERRLKAAAPIALPENSEKQLSHQ